MNAQNHINAIIFDFDGTVANTMPVIFEAFRAVFVLAGKPAPSDSEIVSTFGPTEIGTITEQFPDHEDIGRLVECFYDVYEREHDRLVPPVPVIDRYLGSLTARGIRLGLFTGKGRRSLDISLGRLFRDDHFGVCITGDDISKPKPDPEGLLNACASLDVVPEECLYVGDSDSDMGAGNAAGIATIRAGWFDGDRPEQTAENRWFGSFETFAEYIDTVIRRAIVK